MQEHPVGGLQRQFSRDDVPRRDGQVESFPVDMAG